MSSYPIKSKSYRRKKRSIKNYSNVKIFNLCIQEPPECRLTAEIILALGHKGLGAVRALNCEHEPHDSLYIGDNNENGETKLAAPVGLTSSAEENEAKNVSYSYTLWVGTNVTEVITMTLTSPKNTSFFKAMTQAAEIDSR